ncbi:DUF771 domain-containing protein [Metasolibacillus sp.]|uniref:DUF771 domain-containing protein n=1 Tax=Metasolibacillus sp. TaxID=2703680 RepID=UPI0025E9698E|nr:DUF771 domain-containing protein [Metasolibacillus sp.]MCT6924605.1 DUF771 domain-containing protein [Metasolibacillus sp.]MCT6940807.1 DUF771 domain-containing protein [Metasolibacillus sp.]
MQALQVNLTVSIPEHLVLVEKIEYEQMQKEQLLGRAWTMDDLEERTGRGQLWLKSNLLYVPKFKEQLKDIVHYPNVQGEKWAFKANEMAQFLNDNFHLIYGGTK